MIALVVAVPALPWLMMAWSMRQRQEWAWCRWAITNATIYIAAAAVVSTFK